MALAHHVMADFSPARVLSTVASGCPDWAVLVTSADSPLGGELGDAEICPTGLCGGSMDCVGLRMCTLPEERACVLESPVDAPAGSWERSTIGSLLEPASVGSEVSRNPPVR